MSKSLQNYNYNIYYHVLNAIKLVFFNEIYEVYNQEVIKQPKSWLRIWKHRLHCIMKPSYANHEEKIRNETNLNSSTSALFVFHPLSWLANSSQNEQPPDVPQKHIKFRVPSNMLQIYRAIVLQTFYSSFFRCDSYPAIRSRHIRWHAFNVHMNCSTPAWR